jgi:hypothetical protein
MKNKCIKPSGKKVTQVYVKSPKLKPEISYPKLIVPEQKPELAQVVVRMTKENTDANPKNKGTKAQGRSIKS